MKDICPTTHIHTHARVHIYIYIYIYVVFWLVDPSSSNNKTNHDMRGKIVIFTGKSIYKRETVSNKNIGLVIE